MLEYKERQLIDRRVRQIPTSVERRSGKDRRTHLVAKYPAQIKYYINKEHPFGPIKTDLITNKDIINILFDKENRIFKQIRERPAFIFGRKGSGKTAFLRSVKLDDRYQIIIELKTYKKFSSILKKIEEMSEKLQFVEAIADVWEIVIWTSVFEELTKLELPDSPQKTTILKYLDGPEREREAELDGEIQEDLLVKTATTIFDKFKEWLGVPANFIDEYPGGNVSFEHTRDNAIDLLSTLNTRAVILLDSVEEYDLDRDEVTSALKGLFLCISRIHSPESYIEARFCFPSELVNILLNSSNAMKDFEDKIIISWQAGELIRIAAHRLSLYLEIYENEFFQEKRIANYNLDSRDESRELFKLILPKEVINGQGKAEDPIAYLLRHTQLIPRQLFLYMNYIVNNLRRPHNNNEFVLTSASIKNGVYLAETDLTNEIFEAHRYMYPNAKELCKKCLPKLGFTFTQPTIHKVFNHFGRKNSPDYFRIEEFMQMLIDIGCVGKIIGETFRYKIGHFQYTLLHPMAYSDQDEFCIHPAFIQVFSVPYPTDHKKVIYPYGTGDDDESLIRMMH